jgi:Folylpolyglutamate synthase
LTVVMTLAPGTPPERAWNPAEAAEWARSKGFPTILDENFEAALAGAAERAKTVVVTGSFHTVGAAMKSLGVPAVSGISP